MYEREREREREREKERERERERERGRGMWENQRGLSSGVLKIYNIIMK
jgi:hypothetical protein